MSHEWAWVKDPNDEYSGMIAINQYNDIGGWITVESIGEAAVSDLPTDPDAVYGLIESILNATGCRLAPGKRPGGMFSTMGGRTVVKKTDFDDEY